MRQLYPRIKEFVKKYERHLSSASLLAGFIVDSLTLKRIDLLFENLILFSYLLLAGGGMIFLNFYLGGRLQTRFVEKVALFVPFVIQYALGGLFSGFLLFYSRSGALSTSWPFLLVLLAVLIGNERLRDYYVRLAFQIGIFFFALLSFSIFYVPIIVDSLGTWVFIISGLVSLALILLFLWILTFAVPKHVETGRRMIASIVLGIYAVVHVFYFANILPPIPLSLKDGGVYHKVARVPGGYEALKEENESKCFFCLRDVIHAAPGAPLYAYSAVFAPTNLSTSIVHHWQYFDEDATEWKSAGRIPFGIVGGRDGGYRGYSMKTSVFPGLWRVDVETPRGQVIGRIKFEIREASETPSLVAVPL